MIRFLVEVIVNGSNLAIIQSCIGAKPVPALRIEALAAKGPKSSSIITYHNNLPRIRKRSYSLRAPAQGHGFSMRWLTLRIILVKVALLSTG